MDLLEVGTASSILDGILLDDTGEVEDLLVVLLGELVDSGVETADLLCEHLLGLLELINGLHTGGLGGSGETVVDLVLCLLVGLQGAEELGGGPRESLLVGSRGRRGPSSSGP